MPSTGGLNLGVFVDFDKNKAKDTKNDIQAYMNELQRLINKDALEVTVTVDASKTSQFLRYIKMSTKELKQEAKDLEKQLEILQRTGRYRDPHTNRLTQEATELLQKYRELQTVRERVTQTLAETNKRVNQSLKEQAKAIQKLSGEYKKQGGYLQHLIQRMTVYASIGAVMGFLTKVREVTAEFELQRISLGAIIQDQNKANALFSEIKNFALQSPLKILDLTKYTKQLAAYRIETDKLFDTTKRLADISVGLGVDMQRIILFYGQVRAAGYLRASEVRQATEAGIPLVEELANKLSQARGELVTVGQVMDMISKRQISFQQVAEVFEDLTNKGGIFYNMQEKQGNTLYGMWQKLGDAAQVMYDQIGNTSWVNNALKGSINLLRQFMLAWRDVAKGIEIAAIGYLAFKINSRVMDMVISSTMRLGIATTKEAEAEFRLNEARARGNWLLIKSAQWKLKAAQWSTKAAQANNIATWSYYKLGAAVRSATAALAAFWPMIAVTIVASAWAAIESYIEKTNRLKKALDEVRESANIEISKSVQNFESLANAAINARDGSKEQRDALEELQTTYGKIIPVQDLQIEKLREMKGNYDLLTEAIRNNIAAQKMQEGITTVIENFAPKLKEYSDNIRKELVEGGLKTTIDGEKTILKIQDTQFARMIANVEKLARTTDKSMRDIWEQVFIGEGLGDAFENIKNLDFLMYSDRFVEALREEESALGNWKDGMRETYPSLEKFADLLVKAKENIENATYFNKEGTFELDQEKVKKAISSYTFAIEQALSQERSKVSLYDFIEFDETSVERLPIIDFEGLKKAINEEGGELKVQLMNLVTAVQKEIMGIVPGDVVVKTLRSKLIEISNSAGIGIEKMRQYFWDGSSELKKQVKDWKDTLKDLQAEIYKYAQQIAMYGETQKYLLLMQGVDVDALEAQAKALEEYIKEAEKYLDPNADKKGKKSDTRLQTLQEINQTLEKINKEYNEMRKVEGDTQAMARLRKDWQATLDFTNELARNVKGVTLPTFDFPTTFKQLQEYRRKILEAMQSLKNLKGGEKAILEFQTMISTADFNEAQRQIERKLKDLQDRISQSKTAKEFYDKILSTTGDVDIAANVTMSIYGEDGSALQAEIAQQLREMFGSFQVDVPVNIVTPENRVDYTALQKFLDENRDEWGDKDQFKALEKLASEGQKASAQQVEAWFKEIQKAKDYAQKRVDIETNLANEIANIRAKMLPKDVEETLILGMTEKAAQELDKLQYEAFKDSPMYVELFQDLEHASTTALTAMRDRLMALKGQWQNLDPRQVKELTKSIQKLDEQIIANNPFKALVTNLTELRKMKSQKVLDENLKTELDNLAKSEEKLAKAAKKYAEAQTEVNDATTDVTKARKNLQDAIEAYGEDSPEVESAREELRIRLEILDAITESNSENIKNAKKSLEEAQEEYNAQKEITDKAEEEANTRKKILQNIQAANKAIDEYQSIINDTLSDVRAMMEALGMDDIDLQFFDDIIEGLNQIVDAGQAAATSVGAFMAGDLFTGITQSISAVSGFVTGFINLFYAGRVRKANKEIARQQKLLEQLEYTYGRLQKAADRLFGTDYIQNYNQQIKNLQATAEAYRKQYEAEKSKGKKADKNKLDEYKEAYRDTLDEIADRQKELVDQFLGTDQTSAARDFAQAWIEAKASFENTSEAIKSKYKDMIQNMIIEGAAAKVIDNLLAPMWEAFDSMLDKGNVSQAIENLINGMDEFTSKADNAMNVLYQSLLAKGYDLQQILGEGDTDLTGIARDIATASEESINGLAQGINTQNYYISHVPTISENVAAIRILMEGGAVAAIGGGDYNSLVNEHLAQLPIIAANTLATAERCERAANACEAIAENLGRVIVFKGGKHVVASSYN